MPFRSELPPEAQREMDEILERQHDRYLEDVRANQRVLADFCVIVHGGIALAGISAFDGAVPNAVSPLHLSIFLFAIIGLISTTFHYLFRSQYDANEERAALASLGQWMQNAIDADKAIGGTPPNASVKKRIYISLRVSMALAILILIQILLSAILILHRQIL